MNSIATDVRLAARSVLRDSLRRAARVDPGSVLR
jgi:hypothetical protein